MITEKTILNEIVALIFDEIDLAKNRGHSEGEMICVGMSVIDSLPSGAADDTDMIALEAAVMLSAGAFNA